MMRMKMTMMMMFYMGVELGLTEGHRLRIYENVRYLGLRRPREQRNREDYMKKNFMISTPHRLLFGWSE
jgi:hypothetical protein